MSVKTGAVRALVLALGLSLARARSAAAAQDADAAAAQDADVAKVRYDNFVLMNATPDSPQQLAFLSNATRALGVSFWEKPALLDFRFTFVIPPQNLTAFLKRASEVKLKYNFLHDNLQQLYDEQTVDSYTRRRMDSFGWRHFYNYTDINSWMGDLAARHRHRARLVRMGDSTEGRPMLGVSVKSRTDQHIILEGGIHAREWISPACVTYVIDNIVRAREKLSPEMQQAVSQYNWHMFPVVNPDGYHYSFRYDRNWRKNRRYFLDGNGVDLNRNFDYVFGTEQVSNYASDDQYCGPFPASEKETKNMVKYVNKIARRGRLTHYLAFHSYGQLAVIPYANYETKVENYYQVEKILQKSLGTLSKMHGTKYKIGTAFSTVGYMVSGASMDWVKKEHNVPIVFTLELRDQGSYGFALPTAQIQPTCQETLAALLEVVKLGPSAYLQTRRSMADAPAAPVESGAPRRTNSHVSWCFLASYALLFVVYT